MTIDVAIQAGPGARLARSRKREGDAMQPFP